MEGKVRMPFYIEQTCKISEFIMLGLNFKHPWLSGLQQQNNTLPFLEDMEPSLSLTWYIAVPALEVRQVITII